MTDQLLPYLAVGALPLGVVFPLVAQLCVPTDGQAGARLSYLYVANIAGSTLGTLLIGFWLMDVFSLSALACVAFAVGLGVAAAVLEGEPVGRRQIIALDELALLAGLG